MYIIKSTLVLHVNLPFYKILGNLSINILQWLVVSN